MVISRAKGKLIFISFWWVFNGVKRGEGEGRISKRDKQGNLLKSFVDFVDQLSGEGGGGEITLEGNEGGNLVGSLNAWKAELVQRH